MIARSRSRVYWLSLSTDWVEEINHGGIQNRREEDSSERRNWLAVHNCTVESCTVESYIGADLRKKWNVDNRFEYGVEEAASMTIDRSWKWMESIIVESKTKGKSRCAWMKRLGYHRWDKELFKRRNWRSQRRGDQWGEQWVMDRDKSIQGGDMIVEFDWEVGKKFGRWSEW